MILSTPPTRLLTLQLAGTNPIHNKKPKKKAQDPDDMDPSELAHREKMKAGPCGQVTEGANRD